MRVGEVERCEYMYIHYTLYRLQTLDLDIFMCSRIMCKWYGYTRMVDKAISDSNSTYTHTHPKLPWSLAQHDSCIACWPYWLAFKGLCNALPVDKLTFRLCVCVCVCLLGALVVGTLFCRCHACTSGGITRQHDCVHIFNPFRVFQSNATGCWDAENSHSTGGQLIGQLYYTVHQYNILCGRVRDAPLCRSHSGTAS